MPSEFEVYADGRLDQLARSNRRLWRVMAVLALYSAILTTAGLGYVFWPASQRTIRAGRVELVDPQGVTRVELSGNDGNTNGLVLYDAQGRARGSFSENHGNTCVMLIDEQTWPLAYLFASDKGDQFGLVLQDPGGTGRLKALVSPRATQLEAFDPAGKPVPRTLLEKFLTGYGQPQSADPAGKPVRR